jgi:DNA-binding MarR family transcriptional regulator
VTSALKKGFADAGVEIVKPAYLGVLFTLWREDGLKVVDLGRRAGLEPSTMTGLLDRMERDGLAERAADLNDRRVQLVFLTQAGRRMREPVARVVTETLETVFNGIGEEELAQTKNLLRRVLTNAHKGKL